MADKSNWFGLRLLVDDTTNNSTHDTQPTIHCAMHHIAQHTIIHNTVSVTQHSAHNTTKDTQNTKTYQSQDLHVGCPIFQLVNSSKERVPKKNVFFMVFCQTPPRAPPPPPGMVFLRIKKFTPFFLKLNLWLPKRILHWVPLKNHFFFVQSQWFTFSNWPFKGAGGPSTQRSATFKAVLIDVDMPKRLQTKCKTSFGGPRMIQYGFWKDKKLF